METSKKSNLQKQIEETLKYKAVNLENAYTKSLEQLIEDLKIYQYELEFQNEELQRTQEELEDSRNDFETLFQFAPMGYVILDTEMRLIKCNDAFLQMISGTGECSKNQDFRKIIHPDSQDAFHLFCKKLIHDRQVTYNEIKLISAGPDDLDVKISGNYFANTKIPQLRISLLDISEEKKAKEILEKKEEEIRTITNHMTDMIISSDHNGKITYASPSCKSLLGYEIEEMKAFNIFDFPHPDDVPTVMKEFQSAMIEKKPESVEFRSRMKNGGWKWVETAGNLLFDENQQITKLIFAVRDISERKQIMGMLQESEDRFRSLYENNHANILLIDPETGAIVDANPAAASFYGWKREEMISMNMSQINSLTSEEIFSKMQIAVAKEKNHFIFKHRLADGTIRDVEVYSGQVGLKGKNLLYSLVFDITERRSAEENLEKTKQMLFQTNQMARVGGWEIDMRANQLHWTDVTYVIHEVEPGFVPDISTGISFYKEGYSRETIRQCIENAIQKGESFDKELQIVTARGKLLWVRAMGNAEFKDGKCIRLYGTFQDIDERKKEHEELERNARELAELNKTKDKLFSIIAHDLKSPFSGILGLSDLLKEVATENSPEMILEMAELINASATQAFTLLDNLLAWARMQVGSISINKTKIHVTEEVNLIIDLMSSKAMVKKIRMINEIPEGLYSNSDLNILKVVLRNLVSNAIKFTPMNGEIKISAIKGDESVNVSVSDTGVGIEPSDIAKIFDPGEYFTQPGTDHEKGTGLGLKLCNDYLQKQGGTLKIESTPGKGSIFSFTIPF